MKKIKPVVAGMSFMLVFGLIDNLFLVIRMDIVDSIIPDIDSIVNGGIGNTISDAIGVIAGATVANILAKVLKVKEDETTLLNSLLE